MHVLVTGGAGFIGSHLTDMLLAAGHSVLVIDNLSTGSLANLRRAQRNGLNFRFVDSSVEACTELAEYAVESDVVFHMAAAVGVRLVVEDPVKTLETNLTATDRILRAVAQSKTPMFLASTSEVYGKSASADFRESDDLLLGPPDVTRWGYACSKAFDEFLALAYAREYNIPLVVGRLFNTVGPRQTGRYGMVLPRMARQAINGEPITVFGDGKQTRCFCHVEDTCRAILTLMQNKEASGQVFNIGTDHEISILALAELVKRLASSTSNIVLIPYEDTMGTGFEDILRRRPNLEKLVNTVGFRTERSLEEVVKSVLDFQRSF